MSVTLSGMTWNHPRGLDPMLATSAEWERRTGVKIAWEARSLQDFESFPVEELARRYDLIVIDHPHVGQITAEHCLSPLDVPGREAEREEMARHSVGGSFESYRWEGRQWAFPIDAAAQVQIRRADLLPQPVSRWDEVISLAEAGKVMLPLRPPHSLMCFLTLAANLGSPCATERGRFVDAATGVEVLRLLGAVSRHIDPEDFRRDPIAASELLAEAGAERSLVPLGYGYVSYARQNFRPFRLSFSDIPAAGRDGASGSALGGTGIAVSAFSSRQKEAIDYAYWVASGAVQAGLYAQSGGQPGHGLAWEDDAVNAPVGNFYRNTRTTLERSYVRPRHNGFMAFQDAAAERINAGLLGGDNPNAVLADLERLFERSF